MRKFYFTKSSDSIYCINQAKELNYEINNLINAIDSEILSYNENGDLVRVSVTEMQAVNAVIIDDENKILTCLNLSGEDAYGQGFTEILYI
jgi:hypothetical protein